MLLVLATSPRPPVSGGRRCRKPLQRDSQEEGLTRVKENGRETSQRGRHQPRAPDLTGSPELYESWC